MRTPILIGFVLTSLSAGALADAPMRASKAPAYLDVTSTAFANNNPIPTEFTCEGADVAPPLSWSSVPAATKSVALLVDDPDAPKGTFTHWLVTGIPPTKTSLTDSLPEGAIAAKNDMGTTGYRGPCPPAGLHHYQFRVYALDIHLPKVISRTEFLTKINGHILATGQIVGTYEKKAKR